MSKKHPMVEHLDDLIDASGDAGAVAIQIHLHGQLQPWSGAVRRHPTIAGLYELAAVVQSGEGPVARQVLGTLTFAGEQVSSTMYVEQAGAMVEDARGGGRGRTPGGLVIPT